MAKPPFGRHKLPLAPTKILTGVNMNRSRKLLVVFGLLSILITLTSCAPPTPENITAANIIGRWELVSDGETEWLDLKADGSVSAKIIQDGFIATTLSQGQQVDVSGSWQLADSTITLQLTNSSEPELEGQIHSYKILSITNQSMKTLNASGEQKTLRRAD
jgi:hypothetical protein